MSGILSTSGLPVYSTRSDVTRSDVKLATFSLFTEETLPNSDDEKEASLHPTINAQDLFNKLVNIECNLRTLLALTPRSREEAKANQGQIGLLKQRFQQALLDSLTANFQDDPLVSEINDLIEKLKARFNPSNLFHKRKTTEESPVKLVSPKKQARSKSDKLVFSKYVGTDPAGETTAPITGYKGTPSRAKPKCGKIPLDNFSMNETLRYNRLFRHMDGEEHKNLESELPSVGDPGELVAELDSLSCRTEYFTREELIELLNTYQPGSVSGNVSDEELAEVVELFGIAEQNEGQETSHYNSSTPITVKKCEIKKEPSEDSKEVSEESSKESEGIESSSSDDKPVVKFELTYRKIPKKELDRYAAITAVNSDLFERSKEELMDRLNHSKPLTCGILRQQETAPHEGCYEMLLKTSEGIDEHFFQVMLGGEIHKYVPGETDITKFADLQTFLHALKVKTILSE